MVVRTPITAERFAKLAAGLGRCELVRGEIVRTSPAGIPHSTVVANAARELGNWATRQRAGRVVAGEAGIVTEEGPDTVRGADVAYIAFDRLPRGAAPRGFARAAPELVVEVIGLGRGWTEAVEKAGEYLKMGVERVWVLDPQEKCVHVFRSDGPPAEYSAAERLRDSAILPGFSVRVSSLFRDC